MDIDPNFHESESLFYNGLSHLKKEEGETSDVEDPEEKKAEEKKDV